MSELNSTNAWPFTEIPAEEGLDINAIFGDSTDIANQGDASCCPAEGSSRSRTAGVKCSRRKPHCRGF